MMRIGLVQLTSTDDPKENLGVCLEYIRKAAKQGAEFILTPEVTNTISMNRSWQDKVLNLEEADKTLAALRAEAAALNVWLLIGSLALKTGDADGRLANRSFLVDPSGEIIARYDKIHMFDVEISPEESYRESAGYRPGAQAVLAETPFAKIGMAICYDVRFAHLFRRLAQAGAEILTVPAAFSKVTGQAHWETLLRARAIETGCFVLAPAQTGHHGKNRFTYGHSLIVAPWGEVLADGGVEPGVTVVDIDLSKVAEARRRVPSLVHDQEIAGP